MPLSRAVIAATAVGFCISIAAVPALAANSQPRKDHKANIIQAKGGTASKHKKTSAEPE